MINHKCENCKTEYNYDNVCYCDGCKDEFAQEQFDKGYEQAQKEHEDNDK